MCTHCYHNPIDTKSPLRICRACYDRLGKHGRWDLAWLRSLRPLDRLCVEHSRRDPENAHPWPLYRGTRAGFGVIYWGVERPCWSSEV